MAIRIHIAAAFEGGIPLSERTYLADTPEGPESSQRFVPSPLDPLEVTDLARKILSEITLKLAPIGLRPFTLHPILRAALTQDARNLASYLLRSTGNQSRSLLDLKSIFDLRFQLAAQLPPSAYEPVLIAKGCDPVLARILANLSLRIGRQIAEVARCRRHVVHAIRAVSNPKCREKAAKAKAAFLLEASRKCSAIETLFSEVDKSADEFIRSLRAIVAGKKIDRERISEIVAEIAPALQTPRGRKPTPASATHEFLLEHLQSGYTWDFADEDFCDPFTLATRVQFSEPDFSPRAARRRVNARQNQTS